MKNNIKWVVGLFAIITISLSSCQAAGDSVNLLDVPKLSDENQENIKTDLEKLLPEGSEYVTAKNSEPKQSIFTEDINNDGKQEGFVLYRTTKENDPIHILVLKEDNGVWNTRYDIATNYNYLDYFKLEDLDGDGNKEMAVGMGSSDAELKKQLLIYELEDKVANNIVDTEYEWAQIDDFDGDNKTDLFLLNGEVNKTQTAELYHYDNGQLQLKSSLELTPDAYHENIVSGKLEDGNKAVFIDSGYGAHSMLTEIVAYNKDKLIKVGNQEGGIPLKAYPLYSKDINQDGIIEVGGMYIPKGYEDEALAGIPFIDTYDDYRINGTKQTIEQRYSDNSHNFYITIPQEWYDKVTISMLDHGVKLVANATQKTLFEVKWSDLTSYDGSGKKLEQTKNTVFYTEKEEMLISSDNFHLLEEDFK